MNQKYRCALVIVNTLAIVLFANTPAAQSTDDLEKGLAIAIEAEKRDLGWLDSEVTLYMVLRNKQGKESTRSIRQSSLEIPEAGYGDRSLVVFDSPKDVEGTALLSHTKTLKPDDQWLFLPALKRVKRISSKNKSGPFVGSEFAYEDLLSQEIEKYSYKWLRDEELNGQRFFVVESTPQYKNSGYSKLVMWLDQIEYRVHKIDYYDRKNSLLKTLTHLGYNKYLDQYWRADQLRMVNHQTGKSTDLFFNDWAFQTGQQTAKFTPARLKRAR